MMRRARVRVFGDQESMVIGVHAAWATGQWHAGLCVMQLHGVVHGGPVAWCSSCMSGGLRKRCWPAPQLDSFSRRPAASVQVRRN